MTKNISIFWISIIVAIFCIVNFIFIADNNYIVNAIPLGIAGVLLSLLSMEKLLIAIFFFTPLSVHLQYFVKDAPFDISLPTEPYLVLILFLFIVKFFDGKNHFDKRIFIHPISFLIYSYLTWKLITCLTSTMIVVSLKQFVAQLWFITNYYFVVLHILKEKKYIKYIIWAYASGLIIVCIYTIINHALHGFTHKAGHWVMNPFYKDHTSYGAVLALIIPAIIGLKSIARKDININFFYWITLAFLSVATILSYTRAAWLSLVGALGVWIIVKLNIKFKTIIAISIIALVAVLPFQNEIMLKLKKNNEESSTDFKEHVKSMSNVTSDASNLERINRWNCAIRMFKEKPIFGWGPGTYMFEYAPFQFSYERTIISTNAATLGNAHSEYLGRLSESGVLGLLLFVLIIGFTIHKALSIYSKNEDKSVKNLALYTILGLITYYLHSFLNNFLDTDKLASLFWGFTAIIVALDIYHCEKKEDSLQ